MCRVKLLKRFVEVEVTLTLNLTSMYLRDPQLAVNRKPTHQAESRLRAQPEVFKRVFKHVFKHFLHPRLGVVRSEVQVRLLQASGVPRLV